MSGMPPISALANQKAYDSSNAIDYAEEQVKDRRRTPEVELSWTLRSDRVKLVSDAQLINTAVETVMSRTSLEPKDILASSVKRGPDVTLVLLSVPKSKKDAVPSGVFEVCASGVVMFSLWLCRACSLATSSHCQHQ